MPSQQRGLFGGAVAFDIPKKWVDISNFRQVPDSQEVFADPDSSISVVVEVLERVTQTEDEEAAKFHFDALAHDNEAIFSSIESITKTPNNRGGETPPPTVLKGIQLVPHKISIFLAVFRVESKNVDLVMSMNIPTHTAEGDTNDAEHQQAQRDFDTAVESLKIIDFGLFA